MRIKLNGKSHEHREDGTLADLLTEIGAAGKHIAILVDGNVIPAIDHDRTRLTEGATVEVIAMAGGG